MWECTFAYQKTMSRFGRNYIAVGQYVDYIFPMYNIRFIALTDNIDTANNNSASMEMLPIVNVFNEWYRSLSKTDFSPTSHNSQ